jgi:hypothetical protein
LIKVLYAFRKSFGRLMNSTAVIKCQGINLIGKAVDSSVRNANLVRHLVFEPLSRFCVINETLGMSDLNVLMRGFSPMSPVSLTVPCITAPTNESLSSHVCELPNQQYRGAHCWLAFCTVSKERGTFPSACFLPSPLLSSRSRASLNLLCYLPSGQSEGTRKDPLLGLSI